MQEPITYQVLYEKKTISRMTLNIILYHKFKYNQLNLIQIQIVKTLILKQNQNIFGGNENRLHVVAPGSQTIINLDSWAEIYIAKMKIKFFG